MERCEIIRDLLPVYIDGLASEETAKLVEEHLAQCEQCRTILAQMRAPVPEYPELLSDLRKVRFSRVVHPRCGNRYAFRPRFGIRSDGYFDLSPEGTSIASHTDRTV